MDLKHAYNHWEIKVLNDELTKFQGIIFPFVK